MDALHVVYFGSEKLPFLSGIKLKAKVKNLWKYPVDEWNVLSQKPVNGKYKELWK